MDHDVQAAVIWDQAGYHTSGWLEVPENITLIELPPCSPQLNPMVNLWYDYRAHHWANRIYQNCDDLCQGVCETWQTTKIPCDTPKNPWKTMKNP